MDEHARWAPSKFVKLPDSRYLAYTDYGHPDGYPLVFCHGVPGCRLEGRYFDEVAQETGFRIITPDRPGIGLSAPYADRSLLNDARDIAWLADALGIGEFGVFGWSSGGPVSLATAYRYPARLSFISSISGYTNFAQYPHGRDLLLRTGWPLPKLAQWSETLFKAVLSVFVMTARWLPGVYYQSVIRACGEMDQRVLKRRDQEHQFIRDQIEAMRSGIRDLARELNTQHGDWGFRLEDIQVPVQIFQGGDDHFVPVALAEHLRSHIPESKLHVLPRAGHMFPLDQDFQRTFFQLARATIAGLG